MSTRIEVSPAGGHVPPAVVVAVVVAVAVGALIGSVATRASEERPAAVATRASHWDAQKLEAMEGRMLAEEFRAEDPVVRPRQPKGPPAHVPDGIGSVSASGFRTGGPI